MVEYDKGSKPQYDLILGTETMKDLGIVLDFKAKTITIDEVILPMRHIDLLQGASTLGALMLNISLAMESKITQDATKHVTQILHPNTTKQISSQLSETMVNQQRQLQASKCQTSKKLL